MADFSALKTAIQTYIKQNGNEEITGEILQEILLSVVTTLGDTAINNLVTALADEVAARQNADGTLQQNITNEATARGNADTALQGLINGVKNNVDNGYVYAGIATPSTTPVTGKVFYLALTAGTYTNFGSTEVSQGINILKYNGSVWSLDAFIGIDDTPTPNSPKLVKSGGAFDSVMTDGSAFDISAHFASGGTLATYANLSAALTALNTLSASYKRGGMSIKFVQSSDNKYVQWRLMTNTFSTTVSDWQGVDEEPTAGSDNLVKSGGAINYNKLRCDDVLSNSAFLDHTKFENKVISLEGVVTNSAKNLLSSSFIPVTPNTYLSFDFDITLYRAGFARFDKNFNFLSFTWYGTPNEINQSVLEASYILVAARNIDSNTNIVKSSFKGVYVSLNKDTDTIQYNNNTPTVYEESWTEGSSWKSVFFPLKKGNKYTFVIETNTPVTDADRRVNLGSASSSNQDTFGYILKNEEKNIISCVPTSDYDGIRVHVNRNNGANWNVKVYSVGHAIKEYGERISSCEDSYINSYINVFNDNKNASSISNIYFTPNLKEGITYLFIITGSKNNSYSRYIKSQMNGVQIGEFPANSKSYTFVYTPDFAIPYIMLENHARDDSMTFNLKIYAYNADIKCQELRQKLCTEYSALSYEPVIQKLPTLNSLLSTNKFLTAYANTLVLTDKANNYLVSTQTDGEYMNHVPFITIIDDVCYYTVGFNNYEPREVLEHYGWKLRIQPMSDVLEGGDNFEEYILNNSSNTQGGVTIYTKEGNTVTVDIINHIEVVDIPNNDNLIYMFGAAQNAVANIKGYVVYRTFNTSTKAFSNWIICKIKKDNADYDFSTDNLNSLFPELKPNVLNGIPMVPMHINVCNYNSYIYSCFSQSRYWHGAVMKTQDIKTWEFVFATQEDKADEEFSICIQNNNVFIASRRLSYEQDCLLQKYNMSGVLQESILVQDNIPTENGGTANSMIKLFVYNNKIYLFNNTINRIDANIIKVDEHFIKNSEVVVQKSGGLYFDNPSFVVYNNMILCIASYMQTRVDPTDNTYPLCAICNLGGLVDYSEEDVRTKFKALLLSE